MVRVRTGKRQSRIITRSGTRPVVALYSKGKHMLSPHPLPALDTKALAARWGLKPSTLENWRNLGKGPVYRKIGGRVIYAADDVAAFEEDSKRTSTSDHGAAA